VLSAPASIASAAAPWLSATPSTSTGPTPSPTPTSASPSPSASATPSPSATTAGATASASTDSGNDDSQGDAQVLRPGDEGSGVTELQLRLRQLGLYHGRTSGYYDYRVENAVRSYQFARGITQDEYGVYGPATRARLESETSEP
jgi:peptidoglycan hydrolase-like protein with peptidoglycan-binding domain